MSIFSKFFGDAGEDAIKELQSVVDQINGLEDKFRAFSDEDLKNQTDAFKKTLKDGKTLDDILPEAFACVREAANRTLEQRHFDVQLMGGIVLHQGKIAEMKTGEGKTLSSTLPIYLNALSGAGVHVVTVNDYLAKRDANWMGAVYNFLGLSVSCIQNNASYIYEAKVGPDDNEVTVEMANLREASRKEAYAADITYGTNNEFGFDYLRDNMAYDTEQMSQRGHNFAIVDEVDSILIDEARTPLIISAPDEESTKKYQEFARIVPQLKESDDYNIDEKLRAVTLTEVGIEKVEKILGVGNIYEERGIREVHHLEQALRAKVLFKRDIDYVVKDGEVMIVDQFTGRLMPGRRYSDGLHQAIEAKEGATVQKESKTLATTTFQNYFRMYGKLAGMTGTAASNAEEFDKVYKLEVIEIPTNQPMIRKDLSDSIYRTEKGKFTAVVREIKKRHEAGQPVLVGTIAIEKSELLSAMLRKEGVTHEVLNAKHHEREAAIIARAGDKGAVTIATNMAGRGTDIKLTDEVKALGGLLIIGTERHEARRIDDQLRGRAGRQGDAGSSQFFVSMEDDLMRIFGAEKIKKMMAMLGVPEDMPIENRMISRAIESAQGKIEGFNFDSRKHVLEYDDVMNKHRDIIYTERHGVLESKKLKEKLQKIIGDEIRRIIEFHTQGEDIESWNVEEIAENIKTLMPAPNDLHSSLLSLRGLSAESEGGVPERDDAAIPSRERIINYLIDLSNKVYEAKEAEVGEEDMRKLEKFVILRTVDMLWMEHLDEMEHVRDAVRLRAYGQRDPIIEYKNEAHRTFQNLMGTIQSNIASTIFKVALAQRTPTPLNQTSARASDGSGRAMQTMTNERQASESSSVASAKPEVGRNDPCTCGSGKKFKKCHGKN